MRSTWASGLATCRRFIGCFALLLASGALFVPSVASAAVGISVVPAPAAALFAQSANAFVVGTNVAPAAGISDQLTFTPDQPAPADDSTIAAPDDITAESAHTYTSSNPGFTWSGSGYGTFSGQANLNTGVLQWGWQMSQSLRATATGPVAEAAAAYNVPEDFKLNYGDSHPSESIDYLWHSSIPGLGRNTEFELVIGFTWPGVLGGVPGIFTLYVEHYFVLAAS